MCAQDSDCTDGKKCSPIRKICVVPGSGEGRPEGSGDGNSDGNSDGDGDGGCLLPPPLCMLCASFDPAAGNLCFAVCPAVAGDGDASTTTTTAAEAESAAVQSVVGYVPKLPSMAPALAPARPLSAHAWPT